MKIGIIAAALAFVGLSAVAQTNQKTNMDMKKLELVQEWDKTFPKSDKVEHSKVVFVNRFGVTLAADMYTSVLQCQKSVIDRRCHIVSVKVVHTEDTAFFL